MPSTRSSVARTCFPCASAPTVGVRARFVPSFSSRIGRSTAENPSEGSTSSLRRSSTSRIGPQNEGPHVKETSSRCGRASTSCTGRRTAAASREARPSTLRPSRPTCRTDRRIAAARRAVRPSSFRKASPSRVRSWAGSFWIQVFSSAPQNGCDGFRRKEDA